METEIRREAKNRRKQRMIDIQNKNATEKARITLGKILVSTRIH